MVEPAFPYQRFLDERRGFPDKRRILNPGPRPLAEIGVGSRFWFVPAEFKCRYSDVLAVLRCACSRL